MAVPTVPRVVSLLVLAGAVLGIGAVARARYLPDTKYLPGLRVDEEEVDAATDVRELALRHAEALKKRRVKIVLGDGRALVETTLGDLGLEASVDETAAIAESIGKTEDLFTRVDLARRAMRGELGVPLLRHVSPAVVVAKLESLKEREDVAPVSARLDLDHHAVVSEKDGKYIDLDALAAALDKIANDPVYANEGVATVAVPVASFKPRVSSQLLAKIDITQVVGAFETGFSRGGGQASRARNIEVASSRINGVVLYPGDVMSFNAVVGARSLENGFQKAGEIFKGEMVEGVGGGTCQVASTFHAAAFFGGLDIVERLPHSRPSAYIPLGLDATVVYPSVDMKIKNPYDFPVVIHAWIDGNKVKVELLGKQHPVQVAYGRDVLGTTPFSRKVVDEDWVTKPTRKQKGINGISIRRSRVLAYADGHRRVETSTETYPPTTEIYKVPPGYNPDELPALGEDPNDDAQKKPDGQPSQQG